MARQQKNAKGLLIRGLYRKNAATKPNHIKHQAVYKVLYDVLI